MTKNRSRFFWHGPLALVCCVVVSGCTRTSDGSLELARPISVPGITHRPAGVAPLYAGPVYSDPPLVQQLSPQTVPVVAEAGPSRPPARARRTLPAVKMWKPTVVKAPFAPGTAPKSLKCRNEKSSTGRVRVVCD